MDLAAEVLHDQTHVSWDGVRHVCRLVLAYADYNCAAADSKARGRAISDDPTRVVDALMGGFAELDNIHEDCARAWRDFKSADWSRGAYDVWRANDETFCAAIERNACALHDLRARHFGPRAKD
jgi:hypothetical protein